MKCHQELDDASSIDSRSSNQNISKDLRVKKTAFQCLQLSISDMLAHISSDHFALLLECLASFIEQTEDLNMSLTAIEYLWKFNDFLLTVENFDQWMAGIMLFKKCGSDERNEVRNGAIQSLFRCITLKHQNISITLWKKVFDQVFFELLRVILEKEYEESTIYSIQGLSNLFYSLLDYLIERFDEFSYYWKQTLDLFVRLLSLHGANEKLSMCVMKSFKLLVTAAKKSAHKNINTSDWNYAYICWIKMNETREEVQSQSVLCCYVQCFSFLYGLLKMTPFNSSTMLEEMLQNFYQLLIRKPHSNDVISDGDLSTSLQNLVMYQLEGVLDVSYLPSSYDALVKTYIKIMLIPTIKDEICNESGIALSVNILTLVLSPLARLALLSDSGIIYVLHGVESLISSNCKYHLVKFAIKSLLQLIRGIIEEDLPISDEIYSQIAHNVLTILETIGNLSFKSYHDDHLDVLNFLSDFELPVKVPKRFCIEIFSKVVSLSEMVSDEEPIAFKCLEILFKFSDANGNLLSSILLVLPP